MQSLAQKAIKSAAIVLSADIPVFEPLRGDLNTDDERRFALVAVADWVLQAQRDWEAHPDYVPDSPHFRQDALIPVILGVWDNEGATSYTVMRLLTTLSPNTAHIMRKYAGKNTRLVSLGTVNMLPEQLSSIDGDMYLLGSQGTRARNYAARQELKARLPKSTRKIVNVVRRLNRKPKKSYWQNKVSEDEWYDIVTSGGHKKTSLQPDWYKNTSKKALSIESLWRDYPDLMRLVNEYISPSNLWDCATGKVSPEDVKHKFRFNQLSFF